MASQWTPAIAKNVDEQREGPCSRFNTLSAFELCMAVAARLGRPLTIRSERLVDGDTLAASITIPEDQIDTDADVAAAALSTPTPSPVHASSPSLLCEHGCVHSLTSVTPTDCPYCASYMVAARKICKMAPRPHPPRDATEQSPNAASDLDHPSATSRVASVAPVRRPLPPDVAPDTRIRRLQLRKGAWWAWAPRHDPADDHLYGWLRLDDEKEAAFEQPMERLELVLERLEWAGLRAKTSKCHLFATSVDYLGHVCSRTGVSLDPKKISAVSTINPRSINNLETVRLF